MVLYPYLSIAEARMQEQHRRAIPSRAIPKRPKALLGDQGTCSGCLSIKVQPPASA